MKIPLTLILSALAFTNAGHSLPRATRGIAVATPQTPDTSTAPRIQNTTIEPGLRVGPLKLGDTRDRALELFPKKDEDQVWTDPCGTSLDWVDATNPNGRGDLVIRLKNEKVFQIESATTRFQTAEGITTFDRPDKVAAAYKELRAYALLSAPNPALGSRPLVFWIDKKKGIAFTFAYDPSQHKRYLYKVTVFEPNKTFCPEQETMRSSKWEALSSYALEPPIELSPER
jgi:hypothetical protein